MAGLLRDAGIQTADVDTVFFTGGSSSVPLLREGIATLLPQARQPCRPFRWFNVKQACSSRRTCANSYQIRSMTRVVLAV